MVGQTEWGSVWTNNVSGELHFNGGEPLEAGYDRAGVVVVVSRPRVKGSGILGPQRWGLVLPNDLRRGLHFNGGGPYGGGLVEWKWWWWLVGRARSGGGGLVLPRKTELRGSVLADDRPGEV